MSRLDMTRCRYAIVGVGGRAIGMYLLPLVKDYADTAEVVGLCDVSATRMAEGNRQAKTAIPTFSDFDAMLAQTRPEVVIVCTRDDLHEHYIVKALRAGCDAITEKPMTTDDQKCRNILRAEKETGRKVRVTFNYRYAPLPTRIRELLAAGEVGDVLSVDFSWHLNTSHGADYFRRWHRRKQNSGGLLVHKATHHFDLVNWFLQQEPVEVYATGERKFYGPTREQRGERCLTCEHTDTCEFYFDIKSTDDLQRLYLEAEQDSGYIRDGCVFSPEINIEDTISAIIRYSGGTQMSYQLDAYLPREGFLMAFNGTRGRMEVEHRETHPAGVDESQGFNIQILRDRTKVDNIHIPTVEGGHGGGDARLLNDLFGTPDADPLGHAAGSRAGAMSVLTGIAANHSIASGKSVKISELLGEFAGPTL